MRCSLKDCIVILLIHFFSPSEEKSYPLLQYKNSPATRSMNFNDLLTMLRIEQSLESFPNLREFNKNAHKIVKKQMTPSDYKRMHKRKRSSSPENSGCESDMKCKEKEETEQTVPESASDDKCREEKSEIPKAAFENQRDLESYKTFETKELTNSDQVFKRAFWNKGKKNQQNATQQTTEKESVVTEKQEITTLRTENPVTKSTEKALEVQKVNGKEKGAEEKNAAKVNENTSAKKNEKASSEKVKEKSKEKQKDKCDPLKKNLDLEIDKNFINYSQLLRTMIGCRMNRYLRLPDVTDKHWYYECDCDNKGCLKLTRKRCPGDEIFSATFLECLKPGFFKVLERQKRSLWKKGKKQEYSNTRQNEGSLNAWIDVNDEEEKQVPSEFRPKHKPKLVVYHLKVKKATKEPFRKEKNLQRLVPDGNIQNIHQLFPRSFIIRVNKKEGENVHEKDDTENDDDDDDDLEDDEEEDEEDDEISEEANDSEEKKEDDDEDKKSAEKGGIKEFFRNAKEAITNRARFSEPADTSFTLDKTSPQFKSKKVDDSEKDSKKILIDADIRVDKTIGKTLRRILGKQKYKDDALARLSGSLLSDRGNQDQIESEKIIVCENLNRSNPRLKRYYSVTLGKRGN